MLAEVAGVGAGAGPALCVRCGTVMTLTGRLAELLLRSMAAGEAHAKTGGGGAAVGLVSPRGVGGAPKTEIALISLRGVGGAPKTPVALVSAPRGAGATPMVVTRTGDNDRQCLGGDAVTLLEAAGEGSVTGLMVLVVYPSPDLKVSDGDTGR